MVVFGGLFRVMSVVWREFYSSCLLICGQMRQLQAMAMRVHPYKKITRSVYKKHVVDIRSPDAIPKAANLLESGEVIALPTDTVYGLACSANDPAAIKKLYEIKGRICTKPVAICVPEVKDVLYWGRADHIPMGLLQTLLPGAVTIVVKKSQYLDNPCLNPGVEKIGIRVPKFNFIRHVTKQFKAPMALTSANFSSQESTLEITEFKALWPKLGAVFDGGQLGQSEEQRAASTVIDLSEPQTFEIIRTGVAIKRTIQLLKRYRFEEIKK